MRGFFSEAPHCQFYMGYWVQGARALMQARVGVHGKSMHLIGLTN
jgi:hypothetical protein